jgi:hypothetical protein
MEQTLAIARHLQGVSPALGRWLPRLGVLLLALAAIFAGNSWWHDRSLVHATATVTENVAAFAPGGGVLYRPRLRFRTPEGENVQVLATQGRDEPEFSAGTTVPVAWPSGEPQRAFIATVWQVYRLAIWLAVVGTAVFDVGWILRLRGRGKGPS